MIDILHAFFAFGLIIFLISLLYVLPSYFRRLGELISHLKTDHPDLYTQLGRPSLGMLDSNIRSTSRIVMFVFRKDYMALGDERAVKLGDAARWRLIYSSLGALFPIGIMLIQATK